MRLYIRILRLYIRIAGYAGCIRGAISFVDDNYSMHMVWHYNKYVQNLHVLHALQFTGFQGIEMTLKANELQEEIY